MLNPHMHSRPIGEHDLLAARCDELLALDAIAAGTGTARDMQVLKTALRLARALVRLGYGIGDDEAAVLARAGAALRDCGPQCSGSIRASDDDLAVLRAMVQVLDQQRALCRGGDYARGLLAVLREVRA